MTTEQPFHHRSSLKQRNKPFKSGKKKTFGKTESKTPIKKHHSAASTTIPREQAKADRRNQVHLAQQQKREALQEQRRLFSGPNGAPRVIAVVAISEDANPDAFLQGVLSGDEILSTNASRIVSYSATLKQKFLWKFWGDRTLNGVMEAAAMADTIILLTGATAGHSMTVDQVGLEALSVLRAQGVSSAVLAVQEPSAGAGNHKASRKREYIEAIQGQLCSVERCFIQDLPAPLSDTRECDDFKRGLAQIRLTGVSWREQRAYLVSETVEQIDQTTVKIVGHLRGGKALSANHLVSVPGAGLFSIEKIVEEDIRKSTSDVGMEVDQGNKGILHLNDPMIAEKPIIQLNEGDAFSSERMLAAAEEQMEMQMEAEMELDNDTSMTTKTKKKKRRLPKGTSSYQAAWIIDENDDDEDEDEDEDEEQTEEDLDTEKVALSDENEGENSSNEMEAEAEDEEEKAAYEEERRHNRHFPDEVDVPLDGLAKTRFQKYRGLQSLRTSDWDPMEMLPSEYSRIFQFQNWKLSERKAVADKGDSPFAVGMRVAVFLKVESVTDLSAFSVLFGLYKHENRMTVMNFAVTAKTLLANKEPLVAHFGFRSFLVRPIWSEHSNAPLHRMLRSVEEGQTVVGTVYLPVHFQPCPVILCRPGDASVVVATGSVLGPDPSRIVLKRVTLTGLPFRINNRHVVARFMFTNPRDVNWFRPVELVTRSGCRGHIKESLGTHGYMKCLFDRPIGHDERIAMHLYKRVFPKWTIESPQ